MLTGTVISVDRAKGHGVAQTADGQQFFVGRNELLKTGIRRELVRGDVIEFDARLEHGRGRGAFARAIRIKLVAGCE